MILILFIIASSFCFFFSYDTATNESYTDGHTLSPHDALPISMVENHVEREGRKSSERRYYLSSVKLDAQAFAAAVRAHWGIENRLPWVLDVVFHDDLTRLRPGSGPQNLAVVKHIAMNLVRNPKDKHKIGRAPVQSQMRTSYAVLCLPHKN